MRFPIPATPPILHSNGDIYGAVYDFVSLFCVPVLSADNIIRAWQNRAHPPEKTNEYAVITPISHTRRGSNIEVFGVESLTSYALMICRIQIDTYSAVPETARARACSLEHAARSSVGMRFLKNLEIGMNGATAPRDMTGVDYTEQFLPRWSIDLMLSYNAVIEYEQPTFDAVNVFLEDIDAHHTPPTRSGGGSYPHITQHTESESD